LADGYIKGPGYNMEVSGDILAGYGCSIACTHAAAAEAPSIAETQPPTNEATQTPSDAPTASPTVSPTDVPTTKPPTTDKPSFSPSHTPTDQPTTSPTMSPTNAPTTYTGDTLKQGSSLTANQKLTSANGKYVFIMQGDGNSVIYVAGKAIWNSGTMQAGNVLAMQVMQSSPRNQKAVRHGMHASVRCRATETSSFMARTEA
jgi:hypothetical protein